MLPTRYALLLAGLLAGPAGAQSPAPPALRPPAYPLITHTPYLSLWSFQDELAGGPTRHWTGEPQSLEGVVRVDGRAYQFMGQASVPYRMVVPISREQPYQARYTFKQPAAGWEKAEYAAASTWPQGPAPFADNESQHGTRWTDRDVWVRRTVHLPATPLGSGKMRLLMQHDDDAEVYLNGTLLTKQVGAILVTK